MASPKRARGLRWLATGAFVVLVLVVGGPFVYFHFIQGPAPRKLDLKDVPVPSTSAGTTRAPLAGTWTIGTGSVVRYRVTETLFGQHGDAVGGTSKVTGSMTIAGTKLTAANYSVDMTSISSDESQRDDQFQNRIMDTADFPTATFTLTAPIELAPVPADGVLKHYSATGKLTLHGTTETVTIPITARRTGNVIAVQGLTPIRFSDYDINNPSGGPASVGNAGQLEFVLQLKPA